MNDDLPEGWAWAKLGQLLEFKYGKSLPKEERSGVGQVDVYGSNGVVGRHDVALSDGTTIIVGRKGSVGAVHVSASSCWPIDTTYYIDGLGTQWPSKFWAYCLRELRLGQQEKSSAIPGISRDDIYAADVPVPPLAEQRRMARRIETLEKQIARSRTRLATISTLLRRLRQSVLAAACSGRLTADWRAERGREDGDNPVGWKQVCVSDVIENLKYGTSKKCEYAKRGVPVLRIPNVANGQISHDDLKYAELPPAELKQLRLEPGDVLVIRSNGSVSLVGRSALVGEEERGFAYAGYLIRLRPLNTAVLPEFLNLVLGSYDVRLQVELEARSTSGVNNINSDELRALEFMLPPIEEQREIVRRFHALFKRADRIEAELNTAQAKVEKLMPSLLARAFRGELVPTEAELAEKEGRDYESGDMLVSRLMAARSEKPQIASGRGLNQIGHRKTRTSGKRRSRPGRRPPSSSDSTRTTDY